MGSFIARQPNGLYCRFSTVVDCPTHWNMTEDDYIDFCVEEAKREAKHTLRHQVKSFNMVIKYFYADNMTQMEFEKFLKEVSQQVKEGETNE